jgi:hypothetical protein
MGVMVKTIVEALGFGNMNYDKAMVEKFFSRLGLSLVI